MWRLNIMYRVPFWALRIAAGRERNPSYDQIFSSWLAVLLISRHATPPRTVGPRRRIDSISSIAMQLHLLHQRNDPNTHPDVKNPGPQSLHQPVGAS